MTHRFIENLLHLRKVHNVQQKQLAEAIDKAVATISNWEAGRQLPNIQDFLNICEYFNVPVVDMFFSDLKEFENDTLRKLKDLETNLKRNDLIDKTALKHVKEYLDKIGQTLKSMDKDLDTGTGE